VPQSMTGYGRGDVTRFDRRFIVEIKSVNHRYNEISVRLPRSLNPLEDTVRKMVAAAIKRGKTDVFITLESLSAADVKISVNRPLVSAYANALNEIKSLAGLSCDITLDNLTRLPDVLSIDKNIENESANAEISETLSQAVQEAIDAITQARLCEGQALAADILQKLEKIEDGAGHIADIAPNVALNYKAALKNKISAALDGANFDENRFIMEITLFADKACIDEELTRLKSHISQMKDVIAQTGSIGRGLDFLTQEMNREINTIASKANNLDITKLSVDMKSELEKIREQVQNIE